MTVSTYIAIESDSLRDRMAYIFGKVLLALGVSNVVFGDGVYVYSTASKSYGQRPFYSPFRVGATVSGTLLRYPANPSDASQRTTVLSRTPYLLGRDEAFACDWRMTKMVSVSNSKTRYKSPRSSPNSLQIPGDPLPIVKD
jgi:hypothetical protein